MTTPKRKAALEWFYDRGAVPRSKFTPDAPSITMTDRMEADGQLCLTAEGWTLTDQGRRDLHEATQ